MLAVAGAVITCLGEFLDALAGESDGLDVLAPAGGEDGGELLIAHGQREKRAAHAVDVQIAGGVHAVPLVHRDERQIRAACLGKADADKLGAVLGVDLLRDGRVILGGIVPDEVLAAVDGGDHVVKGAFSPDKGDHRLADVDDDVLPGVVDERRGRAGVELVENIGIVALRAHGVVLERQEGGIGIEAVERLHSLNAGEDLHHVQRVLELLLAALGHLQARVVVARGVAAAVEHPDIAPPLQKLHALEHLGRVPERGLAL